MRCVRCGWAHVSNTNVHQLRVISNIGYGGPYNATPGTLQTLLLTFIFTLTFIEAHLVGNNKPIRVICTHCRRWRGSVGRSGAVMMMMMVMIRIDSALLELHTISDNFTKIFRRIRRNLIKGKKHWKRHRIAILLRIWSKTRVVGNVSGTNWITLNYIVDDKSHQIDPFHVSAQKTGYQSLFQDKSMRQVFTYLNSIVLCGRTIPQHSTPIDDNDENSLLINYNERWMFLNCL